MAILESVNELAKRFGVETEEQTISEQIDAINQKLDESYTGSRDIEESVSQFAKNDGPDARLGTKTITENDTYIALDDELDGYSSVTVNVPAPTPETFEINGVAIDESTATVDKTLTEALQAYESGKNVIFKIAIGEEQTRTTFAATPIYNSAMTGYDSLFGSYAMFINPQSNKLGSLGFYYTDENIVTYASLSDIQ